VNIVPVSDLIRRCIERDATAWAELVSTHREMIVRVLVRTVGTEGAAAVEDLEQDLWGRLLANECEVLRGLTGAEEGQLRAFLYRTALNLGRDHRRRVAVRRVIQPEPVEEVAGGIPDDAEGVEERYQRLERQQSILDALEEVLTPPNQDRDRMIFRAHFVDGLTASEISTMGVGLGTKGVESTLHRLVNRVRALLRSREDAA